MKFEYLTDARSKTTIGGPKKRPVVEVIISNGGKSREFLAVIDSGADVTTMSTAVAEVFGIDWKRCAKQNLLGISGVVQDSYVGSLDIRVKKMSETLTLPVVFTEANIPILLGQEGFFDFYRIKFEKDHDLFEIYRFVRRK